MKKLILLLSMILLFVGFESYADEPKKEPIPVTKTKSKGSAPNIPGKYVDFINAYISENVLELVFDEPEGMVAVSILNDNEEVCAYTYASSMAQISMELNLSPSVYNLEIKTSFGNIYSGYFFYE